MSFILLGILNAQAEAGGIVSDYELLETTILTSTSGSVTFTGLGAYTDYKHLQLRITARGDADPMYFRFNSDTGTNYSRHELLGNGSSVSSSGAGNYDAGSLGWVATTSTASGNYSGTVADILDFSSTTKNTTVRSLSGEAGGDRIYIRTGAWFDTSAVTSVTILGPLFSIGSRFSLYGLRAA